MFEVLDTSTMFVRTGINTQNTIEKFGSSSEETNGISKKNKVHQISVETSEHSALPAFSPPVFIAFEFEFKVTLSEVIIPHLNPPVFQIKRPPII